MIGLLVFIDRSASIRLIMRLSLVGAIRKDIEQYTRRDSRLSSVSFLADLISGIDLLL